MNTLDSSLTDVTLYDCGIDKWGYYLLPLSHPGSLGVSGLIVTIRAKPTEKHFDPEKILLTAMGTNGQPEHMALEYRLHNSLCPRVCPGRICLIDRVGKVVEFFTFGGVIEVVERADETIYSLRSTAPIFMLLSDTGSLADQFVEEVEVEFNTLRALSGTQDSEFECALAGFDAKTLYEVTIRDLWKKYSVSHIMQRAFPELYQMLIRESNWLKQSTTWQEAGPSLEDLLRRSHPA